jgi:hypothetical protein
MLWHWLKDGSARKGGRPVYLGYGQKDPYVMGHRLLAQTLPSEHVLTVPGGHDYASFKALWKLFLKQLSVIRFPEGQPPSK